MAKLTASSLQSILPASCAISTPKENDTPQSFLHKRWMNLGSSTLPAAVIVPSTDEDVVAVVKFAAAEGLKVIPKCGACGGLVVTNNKTFLLDMERFRSVSIDTDAQTVTFGGGALTRDVQPAVTETGFYTGWPNLGYVGMVGNILGGGINLVQGKRGHACDNLISARLVTGSGAIVTVSSTSTGPEKDLFNQLKGAGTGFGVVLSMTLRIYPTVELGLADNSKIPSIRAWFSRENFSVAASLWDKIIEENIVSNIGFILTVAPPFLPIAGQPCIMADASYLGSQEDAERAFKPFIDPAVKEKATMIMSSSSEITTMNDMRDKIMRKGSNMDCFNGLMKELSSATIIRAAEKWCDLVVTHGKDVGQTMTVFHPMHASTLMKIDQNSESFMCHRDRNFMMQAVPWNLEEDYLRIGKEYCQAVLDIARSEDAAKGVPNAVLAGNGRVETNMAEILTQEKIELLKDRKRQWDPKGVFWNPAADGWGI
ncbi:FAD-binding domain-containing protein [Xylariaceae sp. FL0255]|nr:FAD-binding domain-containing protein [Xylariaceae sp. FL0255]